MKRNFVRDLFELRAIVEPNAVRLAAERGDEADIKAMKDALALMRRHTLATEAGRAADGKLYDPALPRVYHASMKHASIGGAVGQSYLRNDVVRFPNRDRFPKLFRHLLRP
ncbi:hypothetical protein J2W22_003399 [Sphingomonas kyeonggiensis]|nr:hypothetical protein [Sphingomonas kyeonggiensis]